MSLKPTITPETSPPIIEYERDFAAAIRTEQILVDLDRLQLGVFSILIHYVLPQLQILPRWSSVSLE